MKAYLSIIKDSFFEAKATKIFWLLIGISSILFLFILWILFTKDIPPIGIVAGLSFVINYVAGSIGIMIAIIITVGFIPRTFEQGSIDLLLSKPISRSGLFLAKFVGGCVFYLVNITYLLGGIYLILGIVEDIWEINLLKCIFINLFLFIIYYSVSALVGAIFRNSTICLICTFMLWLTCFIVGSINSTYSTYNAYNNLQNHSKVNKIEYRSDYESESAPVSESESPPVIVTVLHTLLPKTNELRDLTEHILSKNKKPNKVDESNEKASKDIWSPVKGSVIFIGVMLFLGCMYVSYKDY